MEFLSVMGNVMDLNQWMVLAMFLVFITMLFRGIPVVYALVGVSLIFALVGAFMLDPSRKLINEYIAFDRTGITYTKISVVAGRFFGGTIKNPVLVALPMFIYMGLMLDQSGVAQRMMKSMQVLFGALKGGLALSVMLIGIILAASTGVIGASVVLLGVMGIPTMMKQGYAKPIATGTIAADGSFELSTYGNGDGAVIGKHRVSISCFESQDPGAPPPDPDREPGRGKPLIPRKYLRPETSGVTVEVKQSNEPLEFKLTD